MKVRLSLAQFHIDFGNPYKNLLHVTQAVKDSSALSSSILLLPEFWSSGYDWKNENFHYEKSADLLLNIADLANKNSITIGGSLLEKNSSQQPQNIFSVIKPNGDVTKYAKIHLFGLMDEKKRLIPGDKPSIIEFPWGRAGLAICYDLRFPELFRYYALHDCQVIFIVAEWPLKRIDHWDILLRARAIENQTFIVAVNCIGQTGKEIFGGHSAVFSPWGERLIGSSEDKEITLSVELDLSEIMTVRKILPALNDRRPEIYGVYK